MSPLAATLLVVVAAVAQVAVAPLYPLGAAVAEMGVVAILLIAAWCGPRAAMVAVPALAVCVAFAAGRQPALFLLAYLPLLPAAALLQELRAPGATSLQLSVLAVVGGAWARLVFVASALFQGADVPGAMVVTDLLLPGMVLDAGLFLLCYLPVRLLGLQPATLVLTGSRWR